MRRFAKLLNLVAAKEGYNVYSHEAYTAYLKMLGTLRLLLSLMVCGKYEYLQLLRQDVDVAETKASAEEIMMLIEKIKNKYLQNI